RALSVVLLVALPLFLAVGVIVTVRLAPPPPKTIALAATSVVLDELPLRLTLSPSASATVRFSVPLAPPLAQLPPAATTTVGAWLMGVGVGVGVGGLVGVLVGVGVGGPLLCTANGAARLLLPASSSALS